MPPNYHQNPPDPIPRLGIRAKSFKRQSTNSSARSVSQSQKPRRMESFQSQAKKERESAKPKRFQDSYPVYTGLCWEALQGYLLQKWPNEVFREEIRDDYWVFETPEPLTGKDKVELNRIRDEIVAQKNIQEGPRVSLSPEP